MSVFEFRDWARQRHLPYSIFAAATSIDELVPALQKQFRIEQHQTNVPLVGTLADLSGVPVVKFKDSPWVVVYWSVGRSHLLKGRCRILSSDLKTRVLNLIESDASQWLEWFLYQDYDDLEFGERMHYEGDPVYFKSSLRRHIEFEQLPESELRPALDNAVDQLLSELDLSVVGLDFDLTNAKIERVDVLALPKFPLGIIEFQDCIGHPEYGIFAVKAPIEQVGQVLQQEFNLQEWQKDLKTTQSIYEVAYSKDGYWIPMIQPAQNKWTVVYWMVGNWHSTHTQCQMLSLKLNTRAISLEEEDTSSAVGYDLYHCGKRIERSEWCPGEELSFDSEIREEPEFDNFDEAEWMVINRFFDETFIQEGVYLPSLEMLVSDPWLKRVDLILRFKPNVPPVDETVAQIIASACGENSDAGQSQDDEDDFFDSIPF